MFALFARGFGFVFGARVRVRGWEADRWRGPLGAVFAKTPTRCRFVQDGGRVGFSARAREFLPRPSAPLLPCATNGSQP